MRRALFLLPSDRMGGAESVLRTVAREAAMSRHFDAIDIFVLCLSRTGPLDELEDTGRVRLIYAEATNHVVGLARMAGFVRSQDFDLVVSSATHINAFASLLRRMRRLRTRRLVARESTMMFERRLGLAGRVGRTLYRLYGAQDLIVCQTDRMRLSLDRATKGRLGHLLRTLPNPIDFDRVAEGRLCPLPVGVASIPDDRTKIVWCGRLSPVKSPERAVDVLKHLHDMGRRDMHLVMIGDGPLRGVIEARIAEAGLADHATLVGHLANPCGVMAQCQLGLLTSEIEGFPNVILEMLASGVSRVITTDCAGGLDEISGVAVVASLDPKDLAAALAEARSFSSTRNLPTGLGRFEVSGFVRAIADLSDQTYDVEFASIPCSAQS